MTKGCQGNGQQGRRCSILREREIRIRLKEEVKRGGRLSLKIYFPLDTAGVPDRIVLLPPGKR